MFFLNLNLKTLIFNFRFTYTVISGDFFNSIPPLLKTRLYVPSEPVLGLFSFCKNQLTAALLSTIRLLSICVPSFFINAFLLYPAKNRRWLHKKYRHDYFTPIPTLFHTLVKIKKKQPRDKSCELQDLPDIVSSMAASPILILKQPRFMFLQPFFPFSVIRQNLFYLFPKPWRMVHLNLMSQLMNNHIICNFFWQ